MTRLSLARSAALAALFAASVPLSTAVPALAQDGSGDAASKASPDAAGYLPLEAGVRETSITALQETLFELAALRQNAHQAHWNVVGSDFYQLHEFYEELYASLGGHIDAAGGRIRTLGAPVNFRVSDVATGDELEEMEVAEMDGAATYAFLLGNYAAVSARLYDRIAATSDDPGTTDLLIGLARAIDKDLWMLRAHGGGSQ